MSDVTNLARAVILVMGIPIKVGDYLYAQYECRQNERDNQ